jgi:hypothetical protein
MSRPRLLPIFHPTLLCLAMAFALAPEVSAQTTLSAGDVITIGVTSDANDSFAFVLLRDIDAGTVIRFMDQSFTNATTGVLGTENDMSLTFSVGLTAGTVVRVEDTGTTLVNGGAFSGTKSGSLSGISVSGDQIFIYQGTAMGSGTSFTGRTLIHGINVADTSWLSTGTASSNASYLPTAISGLDLNLDSGNFDNLDYNGTRTGMTAAAYRAALANIGNYTQNDTRFDLATGSFTIENALFLHWDANGTTAGHGGTGTWDLTTQSRFKDGASGTTYLRWVNSSSGNHHTAVFGGTAGTVSVASGGVTASGLQFDTTGYLVENNTITLSASSTPVVSVGSGMTVTVASGIAGTQGFEKTGAGTLILSGGTDQIDGILVAGGTLLAHSALNAAWTAVGAGATLGGNGSIGGDTLVNGSLSTGSAATAGSAGDLTFAGAGTDLTFNAGSTWLIDIVQGATDQADTVVVGGLLALGNEVIDPTFFFTGTYTLGTKYTLATYGSRSGSFVSFADNTIYNLGGVGGGDYLFRYDDGGAITLTAVPEPGSLFLLGAAAGVCWWRRRIVRSWAVRGET